MYSDLSYYQIYKEQIQQTTVMAQRTLCEIKQERRLKRRNTLGGLEISIRHK